MPISPVLPSGVTEYRTLPWQESGRLSLRDAELVLESVEVEAWLSAWTIP